MSRARTRPDPRALDWVCDALGAELVGFAALRGGVATAVHRVRVRTRRGSETDVVLKRFVDRDWLAREPDLAEREAAALEAVAALALPAPRLLGRDAEATHCDVPAIVMSFIPGRPELPARPDSGWLERLAAPLPRLHSAPQEVGQSLARYRPYRPGADFEPPAWSGNPDLWRRAAELLRTPPEAAPCLIHRDYHPCNVLWSGRELVGVTDWTNACRGPIGVDVGHCRMNLVCLYGVDVADEFARAHRALTGLRHDPFWDLRCAIDMFPIDGVYAGWIDLGRRDLRVEDTRARIEAWVARGLAELRG